MVTLAARTIEDLPADATCANCVWRKGTDDRPDRSVCRRPGRTFGKNVYAGNVCLDGWERRPPKK